MSVFSDQESDLADTCWVALEHSVTWLVKKTGVGVCVGGEEAVLDPYGNQLKLIGKSF